MKSAKWLLVLLATVACASAQDALYDGFQNPPAQARPFVRWWWNGIRVTSEETVRELDVMNKAGIGGFEMNPIAMPPATKESIEATRELQWLSPEWNEVVKTTAIEARKRGMIPDLIVGSGWPFGGRFLKSGEQIQIVTLNKKALDGPAKFEENAAKLADAAVSMGESRRRRELVRAGSKPKLVFLRLVPADSNKLEPGIDMMDKVAADGNVRFDVPEGKYILYSGAWREGYREVARGGPGADGPAVDHLNAESVRKYLNRMSDALNPVMGGKMGSQLRAMFCDSLELGSTNWTGDFVEQFTRRRGYDPTPYLHYMVDVDDIKGDSEFDDALKRVRYDFNITVIELFMERFMKTYTAWCNENGMKSRAQSYGRESHPLDTSFLVDIPECETWIPDVNKTPHPCSINRYVASAAHLSGKTEVSCEAMTNTVTVFRILPKHIKRTDDLNFISGTTHSVLHGFNYSPPVAGFPGWVQFGCYFSEQNPWWPYFRKWTDYNARISSVLQGSKAQARVAILTGDADIWSTIGRPYHPFADREVSEPWYFYRVWEAMHQNGFNVEYTSDMILGKATFDGGKINYGPRAYDVLVLVGVKSLLPETAKQIEKLAAAGGKVMFVGQQPHRSPSYKDAAKNDAIVKKAIDAAMTSKNVAVVDEPTVGNLVSWAGEVMRRFAVQPDVKISQPSDKLSQIYHKDGDRDIFFVCWVDMNEPIDFTAEFAVGDKFPHLWNPETGERFRYPTGGGKNTLAIHLEPQESILLVFEPKAADVPVLKRRLADSDGATVIKAKWDVSFAHAVTGEKFGTEMDELRDFADTNDLKFKKFAGIVTYKTTFDAADTSHPMLDLGTVEGVSDVTLNGKPIGVGWYGRHCFDMSGVLKKGSNELVVKVTTHLGNYVAKADRNTPAGAKSWWFPIEPMGLQGPIRLLKTIPQ